MATTNWRLGPLGVGINLQPPFLFTRLELTDKDGWKPPQDNTKLDEERQKWFKDHAATYRIQRFVAEKKEKSGSQGEKE